MRGGLPKTSAGADKWAAMQQIHWNQTFLFLRCKASHRKLERERKHLKFLDDRVGILRCSHREKSCDTDPMYQRASKVKKM